MSSTPRHSPRLPTQYFLRRRRDHGLAYTHPVPLSILLVHPRLQLLLRAGAACHHLAIQAGESPVDCMHVHRELTRNLASTTRPRVPQEPEGQDRGDRRRSHRGLQRSAWDSPRIRRGDLRKCVFHLSRYTSPNNHPTQRLIQRAMTSVEFGPVSTRAPVCRLIRLCIGSIRR